MTMDSFRNAALARVFAALTFLGVCALGRCIGPSTAREEAHQGAAR